MMNSTSTRKILAAASLLTSGIALGLTLAHDAPVNTEAMLDASVSIRTTSHVELDRFGDSVWRSGSGSGVLVSKVRCEVWTNHHVVDGAAFVEVYPRGWAASSGIPARVVNSTPRSDVAILHLERCDGIAEAVLGNSSTVRPGHEAYVVGNPLGQNPDSITRGIISHTERYAHGPTPFLQTDAAINPGNSGGALFNRAGEVIGLNTAIASSIGGANIGIGYAIPINVVKSVSQQLASGPPSWGDAGINDLISNLTADEAEIFGVPNGHRAVSLAKTPADGPAADMLKARDVIYRLNQTPVSDADQVRRVISAHAAGDIITFQLVRAGETMLVDVVLDEGWEAEESADADHYEGFLGMRLEMWSDRDDELARFKTPVIVNVHSLGPAHRGHIASSQKTARFNGLSVVPYQLDVKTITGAVLRGEYHSITTPEALDRIAERAFRDGAALLLEIEMWRRSDPRRPQEPLAHHGTAFFKVTPEVSRSQRAFDPPHGFDGEPVFDDRVQAVASLR